MLIIAFDDCSKWFGGYGDRVIGIINTKLISNILNTEFKIIWEKENVKKYIDYLDYYIDNVKIDCHLNMIDIKHNEKRNFKTRFSK